MAIEDERFYHHKGVDYAGVVRAAVKNLSSHKTVQGGSTITMQLIRNLYITKERTYQRKIREAKLAEELENEHPASAARAGSSTSTSTPCRTARSAARPRSACRPPRAPTSASRSRSSGSARRRCWPACRRRRRTYSPVRAPEKAEARRNEVLAKMAELGMISRATAVKTMKKGLGLHVSRYFTSRRESFFFDFVKDELIKEIRAKTVRQGGLRVDTTIDLKKQQAAREAINGRLAGVGPVERDRHDRPEERLHQGDGVVGRLRQVEVQPRRPGPPPARLDVQGDGADDRAAQGRGPAPHDLRLEAAEVQRPAVGPDRRPDLRARLHGSISLEQATLYSDNTVYEQLALDLGPPEIKQTAYDMGIKTHLDGYPAEALGGLTLGVSPLEMADAYATIASGGYRNRPTAITKITLPRRQVGAPAALPASSARRRSRTASPPRRRGSSRRTSSGHRHARRTSAARRPARPAPPTRSTTRGSSASRRGWPPRCGSAIPTRRSR